MIHQNISEFERIRNMPEEERLLVDDFEETELKSFNDFINKMKHSGYSTIPEVDHFIHVIENKEKENILLKDELIRSQLDFSVLNEELQKFGKRRQHYLNKVKQKGKPKKK
jgi:hypothetical protein